GQTYEIAGVRYTPREDPTYDRTGTASWYGELFHGRYTANGEIYDMDRLSAAHPTLPLPVYAHVTNLRNGRSIIVRVNDRGPFKKNRIIDLSRRSAEVLGFRRQGTAPVRVRYLRRAPLSGDDSYERKYLASRGYRWYASKSGGTRDAYNPIAVASLPQSTLPPLPDRRPLTASSPHFAAHAPPPKIAMAALDTAPDETGSIPEPSYLAPPLAPPQATSFAGPAIQAGYFKNKDNAMRAIVTLAGIGPIAVSPVEVGSATYYRVCVGPFADEIAAAAALPRVTDAGYRGAKILFQN
ncbi:MAG: septal ring lytic transglycosylase RlpA family protein, partial [Alphaproteobacteria bacterium]